MEKDVKNFASVIVALTMCICLAGCTSTDNGEYNKSYTQFQLTFPVNDEEKTDFNKGIFEITPFEVQFQLPEGWSTGNYDSETMNYLYNGVWSRVGIYNEDKNCVGAVGYNVYDAEEVVDDEPMSIYNQISLGNDYQFNVRETYNIVNETDQYQTASVDVYYAPDFLNNVGEDEVLNYGILSHSLSKTVYVAFEFDHAAITDEQVGAIASSVSVE